VSPVASSHEIGEHLHSVTLFDPDFDIEDGGLPTEKPALPKK